jgi:hypothetical protein
MSIWRNILKKALPTLTFCMALTVTTNAFALSCVRDGFDLELTFRANKAADKNVVYVLGKFSGHPAQKPGATTKPIADSNGTTIVKQPKTTIYNLLFSGKVMTNRGEKPFRQNVKVTASCLASWCGNVPNSKQKTIAALTKTPSGYAMTAGPCSPNTFSNQIKKDWAKLRKLVK